MASKKATSKKAAKAHAAPPAHSEGPAPEEPKTTAAAKKAEPVVGEGGANDPNPDRKKAGEEADKLAGKAGLPAAHGLPEIPRHSARMNEVAAGGGVVFSLPQATAGRYAADTSGGVEEPSESEVAARAEELLKEKDRVPAGTPQARAQAAKAEARSELLAARHVQASAKDKPKAGVTKEQAEELENNKHLAAQVFKGADFINNPRAYAADPTNAADQGPAEPIPVDYRRIQDMEGVLAGNLKYPT